MPIRKSHQLDLVILLPLILSIGCKKTVSDPRTLPEVVRVTSVKPASDNETAFTGVVTARVQSDLGFRVAGKVTQRLVEVGQSVHVGQPLMKIDPTDFANALISRTESVSAAEAKAKQAAADEQRYRGLVSTGAIAASTYDQVKASSDSATAELAAARAQASITRDEGKYTILLADANGVIVQTLAEPGQVVTAGQTVIKLAHAGPREAAINLPETIRPKIGSSGDVKLYGNQGASSAATLRQLSDSADPQTRTFEARYVLHGNAAKAPLGTTVTLSLIDRANGGGLTVPLAAITDRGSGPGVWVISSGDKVSFKRVQVSSLSNEEAVLSEGPSAGTKVVAMGAHLLSEGQQVRVQLEAVDAQ